MSLDRVMDWLENVDPNGHRRIKGLRLVTAFGLAAMAGRMPEVVKALDAGPALSLLAGGFALWASVSEARPTRAESSRDLLALCVAAAVGAASFALLAQFFATLSPGAPEIILISGAFCTGYLRRYGILGAGMGSQLFIGQLLAYGSGLGPADIWTIGAAGFIAAGSAIIPRVLSGPAEKPAQPLPPVPVRVPVFPSLTPELAMGLQAMAASLAIVALTPVLGLTQPAWGITAATYVIAGSSSGTMDRVRRRIVGTAIGVPLGLACLPIAHEAPLVLWTAAAIAMVCYAMSLPERYDIASGAFAFTLVITLAATGQHAVAELAARAWETILGGCLGLAAAFCVLPLRVKTPSEQVNTRGKR